MQQGNQKQFKYHHATSVLIGLSNWAENHSRLVRRAEHILIGTAAVGTLVNAGLFTVQKTLTPAYTNINGKSYSLISYEEAGKRLDAANENVNLVIKFDDKNTVVINAKDSGVRVNASQTFAAIRNKKGWDQLPLVGAVKSIFSSPKPVYDINQEVLAAKLSPYITETVLPATNANITVPADVNTPVAIIPEAAGSELSVLTALEQMSAAINGGNFEIEIAPKPLMPRWTTRDITAFMPAIEVARRTSIDLRSDYDLSTITSEKLAPMLRISTDTNKLKMTLDLSLLTAYLNTLAPRYYQASVATKTTQENGVEVSRSEGASGKQLDIAATAKGIATSFENGVQEVTPAYATLTPDVLVAKTYSNNSDGLYTIIDDFAKSHTGSYRVAAVELGGANRAAFYDADSQTITASIYKMYVAYGVMLKIEDGSWTFAKQTYAGSVGDCMYKMIHVSDNTCAEALEPMVGYSTLAAQLKKIGVTSTNLINPDGDKHTTARDEMTFMTKLYNGELLNKDSTDYLIGLMKGQVYRSGIPAGSNGAVVADKVGFLYALNNDIAIVYAPKSTYALVVLTDGAGGWTNVKLLAQQIYDFYNQ